MFRDWINHSGDLLGTQRCQSTAHRSEKTMVYPLKIGNLIGRKRVVIIIEDSCRGGARKRVKKNLDDTQLTNSFQYLSYFIHLWMNETAIFRVCLMEFIWICEIFPTLRPWGNIFSKQIQLRVMIWMAFICDCWSIPYHIFLLSLLAFDIRTIVDFKKDHWISWSTIIFK